MLGKPLAWPVLGGTCRQHADLQVSATTLRSRRDEWIAAGVFDSLHQAALRTTSIRSARVAASVRVAVTGRTVGLPLFESMESLGSDRTLGRLRSALNRLG